MAKENLPDPNTIKGLSDAIKSLGDVGKKDAKNASKSLKAMTGSLVDFNKKMGGKKSFQENDYKFRKDWDEVKLKIMEEIIDSYYKNNPELLKKLKETGDKELLHTGPRIDTYWGVNSKGGNNHHGKILMKIRDE